MNISIFSSTSAFRVVHLPLHEYLDCSHDASACAQRPQLIVPDNENGQYHTPRIDITDIYLLCCNIRNTDQYNYVREEICCPKCQITKINANIFNART